MRDTAYIGWSLIRGAWRLFLDVVGDALGDGVGGSLPYLPAKVLDPVVLTDLLEQGALVEEAKVTTQRAEIVSVTQQNIPSISSNCVNLTVSIEQAGEATLPASLFVKVPMQQRATRFFFSVINAWQLESHFFAHVAKGLPFRTPITYATQWRRSRFYLIQENLREDPSVELFVNPDMVQGPSLERVYACLDTFAKLHAHYHGMSALDRESLLPTRLHPFLSRDMGTIAKNLNRLALNPCMKKRPNAIPDSVAEAFRTTIAQWDKLLKHWFSEPLTLLHGDSHLGNFFVSGQSMGMLDWQAAHWGKGIRDVQYFLIDSLPAATLAEHERALVSYYVERCAHYGAPIDADETWEHYRSFTFHTLMTIVVSVGFGALNEEQAVLMDEILDRSVAAVQRVDYPGWLSAFLEN
ncbi:MAG: phosphotransferase [Halioglobus sp.]